MFAQLRAQRGWLLFIITIPALLSCLILAASAPAHGAPERVAVPPSSSSPNVLCGSLTFASPVTYTANTRPRSSTTGYLNSDANLDLVVTDYSANGVSVFLGNSNGTFQPGVSYSAGVHPVSVAIADFNEDTIPDLVVSNYDSGNVSILLGNGDGTFQGPMNYSSNTGPYGVAVGDFDENSHMDVATSNVNFGTINIMLGNGNGSLQGPVPYAAGLRPQVIKTGHFNADNHLDLVVPNYTASSVSVFLGNGNGTFQAAVPYTMAAYPDYVTVADLNNDNKDDLILSHYVTTNTIGVALGNGNGGFGPETTYPTGGYNPTFASVGDFNGDGIPDLVSPGYLSDNVSILLGNGDGTFQSPVSFPVASGSSPVSVLAGDFNHDGRLDMFTSNENTNDISVFLNTCPAVTATPAPPTATSTATSAPTHTPSPIPSPSPTSGNCRPWQWVPSDNEGTFDSTLFGVSAASANDIWAVGNYFNANFYSQTLIEHWNGTAWTVVPSPNPGTANNFLFGVGSLAANNAWAVGWKADTNIQQPLVLHWDGSAWTEFSLSVSRPRVVLQAISAVSQNDIWAVGVSCDTAMCNRHITATLHWDGSAWSVIDSPNPAPYDNSLDGVAAVSSSNVWAVGEACTGNGCAATQSLIEHWDGTAWTVVPSPSPGTAITTLFGVDASAIEAWAVGETCASSSCVPAQSVTLHWNGTAWSVAPSPNPGSYDTHLNAVTLLAANDAWAVGSESSDGTIFGNVVMHWDGSAWSAVTVTSPGSSNNDLNGLTRLSANDIWAVGDFDNGSPVRTQAQHYTGPCTSSTPSATPAASATATITIAASPTTEASATIVTATGTPTIATATASATSCVSALQVIPSPNHGTSYNHLYGVAVAAPDDVWAVGYYYDTSTQTNRTLIEHWDGSSWYLAFSPNSGLGDNIISGVAAVSSSDVWAVGYYDNGVELRTLVEHWNGSAWSIVTSPSPGNGSSLSAVAVVESNDVWAAGGYSNASNYQTLVEHWNGSTWSIVPSPNHVPSNTNALNSIAAEGPNDVWAVGEYINSDTEYQTLVEHWNGSTWSIVPSPNQGTSHNYLHGVAAVGPGDVWAVGYIINNNSDYQTLVEHWNDSTWSIVPSPNLGVGGALAGVAAISANDIWAAGTYFTSPSESRTLVERWDGSAWNVVPSPNPGITTNELWGVAVAVPGGAPNVGNVGDVVGLGDIWVVGDYINSTADPKRTLVERYTICSPSPPVTSTPVPPTATVCPIQFSDVPAGSTFYPYIHCLACRGIINGYSDGTFKPNNNVTRGQLSKIVSNAAGFSDNQTTQLFQDVPVGSIFFQYIGRLASRGYVGGYACGGAGEPCVPPANLPYFRPGNNATRGQISKIVSNAAGFIDPPGGQQFEDVPVGSTYYTYTYRLATRNVMQGYACGGSGEPCIPPANLPYFRPNNNATRGQTSKIVGNTFFPDCSPPR